MSTTSHLTGRTRVVSHDGLRKELIGLIAQAGSDNKACELLRPICSGFPPDRSTLGRLRRGEGKTTFLAMTVALLRRVVCITAMPAPARSVGKRAELHGRITNE